MLSDMWNVNDFFYEVVRFAVGTYIVGLIQMLMGYIFVTTMNYAAEGQVSAKINCSPVVGHRTTLSLIGFTVLSSLGY